MTKIVLCGAAGRMGRAIAQIAKQHPEQLEIVGGVDKTTENMDIPIATDWNALQVEFDVIIDFSNPVLLDSLLEYSLQKKIPLVICTTGYDAEQIEKIKSASKEIPIFFSANMSLGINLLAELCKKASQVLGMDYDIEIIEKHHNQKLDAPSGTALLLANEINSANDEKYDFVCDRSTKREKRSPNEIGIQAVRGGSIVGEHEVIFAGLDEVVSLSHVAYSRNVFANGALKAAEFIKNQPKGLYSMKDLL